MAFLGAETTFPVTEGGVLLASEGDVQALAENLEHVLSDTSLLGRLKTLSADAYQRWFDWPVVARTYAGSLGELAFS